jgi:hypothetical protein
MPFSVTGWAPSQLLNGIPSAIPSWEDYWKQQEAAGNAIPLSLLHSGQFYDFPTGTNPSDVRIAHGDTAENYNAGIAPNSGVFASADPREIADFNSAQRDTSWQGIGRVAALVGGGAALGATAWGQSIPGAAGGATAGGGATTFPLATGGPVSVSPLAGAGGGVAAGGNALAAGGGAVPFSTGGIAKWFPYIMEGANALLGYRAAGQAADASEAGSMAAIAEGARQYDQSRSDQMPWLVSGRNALAELDDPNGFTASPDYNFVRSEGIRDIGNSFAARGGALSGNALRAITDYGSNVASGEYGNWFSRRLNKAGMGADTASNLGALGANTAANAGNAYQNAGEARSSGILGKYGALANGANGAYNTYRWRRAGY